MNKSFVFEDKDYLVHYLLKRLDNPSIITIDKTLYFLYALYGAFVNSNKNSPLKELFKAHFEADKYGPIEIDVHKKMIGGYFDNKIEPLFIERYITNITERNGLKNLLDDIVLQVNCMSDFALINRTHQDNCWITCYMNDSINKKMNNLEIIQAYKRV